MKNPNVLAIAGWDRSGSTIVANVLGSAEGVVSVGEITNLWRRGVVQNRPCGCGTPFDNCEFWAPVMERAFAGHEGHRLLNAVVENVASIGKARMVVSQVLGLRSRVSSQYEEALTRLYRAIDDVTEGATIVDGSKKPLHFLIASQSESVDLKVVHLARDPRGVAHSMAKILAYDGDDQRPLAMDRHGPFYASAGWVYRNRMIAYLLGRSPSRYLAVRYSDFTSMPSDTIARILAFVGHQGPGPIFPAPNVVDLPTNHSVSGNPSRFRTGPVEIREDSAWEVELPALSRFLVSAIAGRSWSRFGVTDLALQTTREIA